MSGSMTLLVLLVLFTSSPTMACKGKATAAAGATSKQDNDNRAETTINMGDMALFSGYHEQTVIMSTVVIFISAIICWVCYFFIKRHGICRKPVIAPRRGWGNMSFRTLRARLDAEEAGAAPVPNRCQNLDRAGHGK